MNRQARDIQQDLLQRRLALVAQISALNARMHKLIQETSGMEMEILRLELAIARDTHNQQLVQELHDMEDRAADTRSACADCEAEAEAVEVAVREIDRQLAAAKGGLS